MASDAERQKVLALLRAHGWNATSFQILERGFSYWFWGEMGCVAYVDTGAAWVAAGAPVAPASELAAVARDFGRAARERRRRVVFFATEQRFAADAALRHLLIGQQPVWNPTEWPVTVRSAPALREQLRRARAKGVRIASVEVAQVTAPDAPLRLAIEQLIQRWAGVKPLPQMGFLVKVDPFDFAEERRMWVAWQGSDLVGFAAVVPVYARRGWFIEDLIRAPRAPNGTTESLVDAAMRAATADGSEYLTLGLSPLAGGVTLALHWARRAGSALYDFDGLWFFKAKFRPRHWVPIYLSYPCGQSAFSALHDSLVAFARRGLAGYGLETLLRGPSLVLRALAALLVPWTVILALADDWFPAPGVQWAWVCFDVVMALGLWALSLRYRQGLCSTLIVLSLADVGLTLWQIVAFNASRVRSAFDLLVVAVAALAPAFAAVVLINLQRRMHGACAP